MISDGEFKYKNDKDAVNRISTYLFSERPGSDRIKALYQNSKNYGVHPRLLASGMDFERFAAELNRESRMGAWLRNAIKNADDILLTEPAAINCRDSDLTLLFIKCLKGL